MLAGCSPALLSPRHRLVEASDQFQACHFPSMSTPRLELPCNFPRKDVSRSRPIRPVSLSVEKPIEAKTSACSIKRNIRLPPSPATAQTAYFQGTKERKDEFWGKSKSSKKRYAEQSSFVEEASAKRARRERGSEKSDDYSKEGENLSLGQFGSVDLWLQSSFDVPCSFPFIAGLNQPQVPFYLTCSGEEEHVYFGTEIADLGEGPRREASESSTSLESHGLVLRLSENPLDVEIGNGTKHNEDHNHHDENDGLELVNLLVACAGAFGSKNIPGISYFIARLGELASPRGSTIHRVIAYFTEALALRAAKLWPHIFHLTPPREFDRIDAESNTALRLLNQVSPIPKFIHFTANEILLGAFEGKARLHIIDFDIMEGLQWASLFQSLASRTNPPSHVRITGIGESKHELIETGERLSGFAEALNLPFEFHPVVDRLEDVRLWMLHVKENESVAVNCVCQMHKILYDSNGEQLKDFLGLIRSVNPIVVIMAEQEAEHNDPTFETRLGKALQYYSAIFDSIDSSLPLDEIPVRTKIEEMFGHEIRNIVACEGRDRFERHESFTRWHELMEQGGFQGMLISERELLQSQMLLRMYTSENYRLERQGQNGVAAITLSWSDQPLYTVSAWGTG